MSQKQAGARFIFDQEANSWQCRGDWTVLCLQDLLPKFKKAPKPANGHLTILGKHITHFDCAGALTLIELIDELKKAGNQVALNEFTQQQLSLIGLVRKNREALDYHPPKPESHGVLYETGKETINKLQQTDSFIILLGELCIKFAEALGQWHRFQFPAIVSNINSTGISALPILALLSFLIGVVLAYQMGLELETYGANSFIAYLSGMAIFREFAPLITAIIVAGRTSSAFTAQIGSMKINEEIDAIKTMGLSPIELLVMPKVLGLLLVFPLLIFWANTFGILGAMLMSKFMLHIGYLDFLSRLKDTVGLKQMLLGLYKAPAFAILIALIGCFQGFRVQNNADSIGSQTTRSVVQALFFIIVCDAAYSICYSWMGL